MLYKDQQDLARLLKEYKEVLSQMNLLDSMQSLRYFVFGGLSFVIGVAYNYVRTSGLMEIGNSAPVILLFISLLGLLSVIVFCSIDKQERERFKIQVNRASALEIRLGMPRAMADDEKARRNAADAFPSVRIAIISMIWCFGLMYSIYWIFERI